MTPDELRRAQELSRPDLASWGFTLVLGVGLGLGFGFVGGWLGHLVREELRTTGSVIGWGVAAIAFASLAIGYGRHERRRLARGRADVLGQQVEEISVQTERAVALEVDHSSVDPATLIDIGDDKLLLLCGQWLTTPSVFGGDREAELFPSNRFTVTRLPATGEVLSITVEGAPLQPEGPIGDDLAQRRPRPSEVLAGNLDRVAEALAGLESRQATS